jgi:hypothetical protein
MKKVIKNGLILLFFILSINSANAKCLIQMWGKWILIRDASCTDVYEHLQVSYCADVDDLARTIPKITQTSSTEAVIESNGKKYQLASDEMHDAANKIFTEIKTNKRKYTMAEFNKILKPIAEKKGAISAAALKKMAKDLNVKKITFPHNT